MSPSIIIHEINLNSNNFNQSEYDIMKLNEKWFINLSSVNFPLEVQGLLQLGDGFCLLPCNVKSIKIY